KPVVREGWLWIDSGDPGEFFEVRAPDLRIRNLGTRFGVKVAAGEPTEVHLIQGMLEVTRDLQTDTPMELGAEERAWAIPPDGEATSLPLARDPFRGISGLLDADASYSTTILSQSPSNYWRINDAAANTLANEVPDGVSGGRHPQVAIREGGLSPTMGFHGFAADNRAALLPGTRGQGAVSLGVTPVHQGELFRYDFMGGKGNLHGAVVSTPLGRTKWVASPVFNRDGSITPGPGSATLAFSPVDGVVYTLDGSVTVKGITGSDSWIGLGFAHGQSGGLKSAARFISGHIVEGRAWMLARGENSRFPNMAHTLGNGDPAGWTGALANANGGDLDLRIILDTTAGADNWTASWYAKRPKDTHYVQVRERSRLPNELISSVGFAVVREDVTGRIASFSLRADQVPRQSVPLYQASGPASVARGEGAVSFWLRRDREKGRRELLWTAGENPADDSVQLRLEADGCVGFFMENGRYDVLISAEEGIADGRWHHLVTSWDKSSVDLYLDGRRVASDREFRAIQHGILRELRFGHGPAGSETAPFAGWIDEIAVWDRALTAPEVERQYHSARGR
ncbi:MAG: LamG domain-containing protein, partial [Akkermansiaceae bacterium]|nr:LamG domain-containing protein [Akkermansiaceae bacterium]